MAAVCVSCQRAVHSGQQAVDCDRCSEWTHRVCNTGISIRDYRRAVNGTLELAFTCVRCRSIQSEPIVPAGLEAAAEQMSVDVMNKHLLHGQAGNTKELERLDGLTGPGPEDTSEPMNGVSEETFQVAHRRTDETPNQTDHHDAMSGLDVEDDAVSLDSDTGEDDDASVEDGALSSDTGDDASVGDTSEGDSEQEVSDDGGDQNDGECGSVEAGQRDVSYDVRDGRVVQPGLVTRDVDDTEEDSGLSDDGVVPVYDTAFTLYPTGDDSGEPLLVGSDCHSYRLKNQVVGGTLAYTYWQCSVKHKEFTCPASVISFGDDFRLGVQPHRHGIDVQLPLRVKLTVAVKQMAADQPFRPAAEIVEEVCTTMVRPSHRWLLPDAARLERCVERHRAGLQPSLMEHTTVRVKPEPPSSQ